MSMANLVMAALATRAKSGEPITRAEYAPAARAVMRERYDLAAEPDPEILQHLIDRGRVEP